MIIKESKKKDEDLRTKIFYHSFDIITVTLSLPWQYNVVTRLAKNFIITVEPCFMETHLIQTPGYYGQFALSLGKAHTLSVNSNCLIRTPVNVGQQTLVSCPTNTFIWKVNLTYADTLLSTVCSNKPSLFQGKKPCSWQHVNIPSASVHQIGWFVDVKFRLFWHQTSYAENNLDWF